MKRRKKKSEVKYKNKRKLRIKTGTLLIVVFLLIYIPSFINWVYGRNIRTGMINNGIIEDSVNTYGYIIREEKLIYSPFEGLAIMEYREGEKVAAKQRIATIYNESSEKLLKDLTALDEKILKYKNEKFKSKNIFSEDITRINKDIEQQVDLLIERNITNALGEVPKITDKINALMKKRAEISKYGSSSDTYLQSLLDERGQLEKLIEKNTKEIFSETPGIISCFIDDYETILRPGCINQLTPEQLEQVETVKPVDVVNNLRVKPNEPFVRLIKGIEYNIVAVIERKNFKGFNEGDSIEVRFNDIDKTIRGTIDYTSDEINGKHIISIKIDRLMSRTSSLRKVNIDLIKRYYEGYKVPVKSLKKIYPLKLEADIVMVEANTAHITRVKIKGNLNEYAMNDEYAIIYSMDGVNNNPVELYDAYVINPENIEEGQVINP